VDARDYIVTIGGIKRTDIVKARADIVKAYAIASRLTDKIVLSANASDCVIAS
jgi:hypothetical protein